MNTKDDLLNKLSTLMRYPTGEYDFLLRICGNKLERHSADPDKRFAHFCKHMTRLSHHDREELFTATFDLKPKSFPYAGYHIYGEDYKRGLLMAGLKEGYKECGMDISDDLPDFVPLLLNLYIKLEDREKARSLRDDLLLPGMGTILEQLEKNSSVFADIYHIALNILEADKAAEQVLTAGATQ